MSELKACPICQTDNMIIISEPTNDKSMGWNRILHPPETPCGISLIHEDRDKLIESWNTRSNDAKKLYEEAIQEWGEQSQIEMIKEECLELALALQKMNRVGGRELDVERYEKAIDEIADVEIMIEQARVLFSSALIDKRKEYKLKRLAERLEVCKQSSEGE